MKIIVNKIEGETVIKEDTQLLGMIVGTTIVSTGIILQLNGMIVGDLILENGATVYINGMVNGNVSNRGGHLEIFGVVNGRVNRQKGETIINPNAKILDIAP